MTKIRFFISCVFLLALVFTGCGKNTPTTVIVKETVIVIASFTFTPTITATPTNTRTQTLGTIPATFTATASPTGTSTLTASPTFSATCTYTATPSSTKTATITPTPTATVTATNTPVHPLINQYTLINNPFAVASDHNGHYYVADIINSRVIKITTATDSEMLEFGSYGTGPGQFSQAMGIAMNINGNILVSDQGPVSRVEEFTPGGSYVRTVNSIGLASPMGLTTGKDGNIYVAGSGLIYEFAQSGTFIRFIGQTGPPYLGMQISIAADSAGNLYVADTMHNAVQKLDSDGNYLMQWPVFPKMPLAIAIDGSDRVYVAANNPNSVDIFDTSANYLGGWTGYGNSYGNFGTISGIDVDPDGHVYITDKTKNLCSVFAP